MSKTIQQIEFEIREQLSAITCSMIPGSLMYGQTHRLEETLENLRAEMKEAQRIAINREIGVGGWAN